MKIDEYKANIETKVIQENDLLLSIPFYVMKEYFVYNNIIYFRGVSNENDIYGIYAYDMKNKTAELIFDGEKEANGYTNNFIMLD